ncbi:hypothetical protein D3C76_842380 [compost metagenome]
MRPVGFGAGGDDHQVRAFLFHQCAVDAGVAQHAHAGQFHFPLQVGGSAAEFRATWQQLRQVHLSAELRRRFA